MADAGASSNNMDQRDFGRYLRAQRKSQRLTQAQLAERAQVSLRSIVYWESGQFLPREQELRALLSALEVTKEEQSTLFVGLFHGQSDRLVRRHPAMPSELAEMPSCGPGDLLTALRMRQGMSREQIATRLQISLATLSRWENNRYAMSEDALAQLGAIVSVSEAEMTALRSGLSRLSTQEDDWEFEPSRPYDHEEAMQWVTQFGVECHMRRNKTVDLTAFALRRRLWRLSMVHPQARFAFARVSLDYAAWLFARERPKQAALQARKVLRIYEKSPPQTHMDMPTVLNLLSACGFETCASRGADAALHFLRPWLSRVRSISTQVMLFSDASLYAARTGNTEMARRYFGRAEELFARCDRGERQRGGQPSESTQEDLFWYLHFSHSRLLLGIGKPWEAFQVLRDSVPSPEDTREFAPIPSMILYAEIALAAGERGLTEQWLRRAYHHLEPVEFPRLQKRAESIALQL